jgi:hypothetical protein
MRAYLIPRSLLPLLLLLLLLPSSASAQTVAAITGYEYRVAQAATPTVVFQSIQVVITAVTCGQPPGVEVTVNPTKAEWADPAAAGMTCVTDITSFIRGLPSGAYVGTVLIQSSIGPTPPSPPSKSFTVTPVLVLPPAPTGLKHTR